MNLVPGVKQIPEITKPTEECPKAALYHAYDGMGTEVEVLEFLYGLVRLLKPEIVVETGSWKGFGTVHLAQACKDNEFGKVYTCETNPFIAAQANGLLIEQDLNKYTHIKQTTGVELIKLMPYIDFAFLDSALTVRVDEAELVLPKLRKNGVIVVHDTSRFYVKNHPEGEGPRLAVRAFVAKHDLSLMQFDTPRGVSLLRRKDD